MGKMSFCLGTKSVLDVRMGHTLLCVLRLFLLNPLLYCGHTQGFAETGAKATVTADRTVIPAGGSVTLTCSVQDPTVVKYHWFRQTSTSNKVFYKEAGGSNRVSVSQGGIYTCRGLRNERSVTPESDSVTIEETVPDEATVTLQPNWPLIYRGETITVRCEIQGGGRTEWTYEWKPDKLDGRPTHNEYRITAAAESDSGKYSCRGRNDYLLTEWSKVITLTVSANTPNASLRADSAVIPAEGSVTLTCSVDGSEGWRYSWFRRSSESSAAQTIRDDAAQSTVSISEGGIYHCRGRRGNIFSENSRTVMIDKTGCRTEKSSFTAPFITGLVTGILLIIFLLLLLHFGKKIKNPHWTRFIQFLNISQDSATEQTVNQNDPQVYSSLVHDGFCLYETIRVSANTGRAQPTDESSNITSSVQAGGLDESRGCDDTEENPDYYNVNPAAILAFQCMREIHQQNNRHVVKRV